MRYRHAVIAAALVLASSAPAYANWHELQTTVPYLDKSPVVIMDRVAYIGDSDTSISCVSFVNKSNQPATAIQVSITERDAFEKDLETNTLQVTGEFSPGVPIRFQRTIVDGMPRVDDPRCYENALSDNKIRSVFFRIEKVRYADGTVWLNDPLPKGSD